MQTYKQLLKDHWYVRTESAETEDLTPYRTQWDPALCLSTDLPALIKDLFPKADTPIWYYKTFHNQLLSEDGYRICLCFDKVVCLCEAFVNGIPVGTHIHSEEPFEFDITDTLQDGENLIALRVYGPVPGKVGPHGISMQTMPNFAQVYAYYTAIPMTGIYGEVFLRKQPLCAIRDLYVNPDPETKTVTVSLIAENRGTQDDTIRIQHMICEKGLPVQAFSADLQVSAGCHGTATVTIPMGGIRLWSPDDPYLYTLQTTVETATGTEALQKRFGFKTLRIENGWFVLNGKRIWLTCAHTIETKEAVVHAKTMGFRALRYLTAMPSEEILDLCDEIGMLVYEECAAAWGMQDYPDMPRHMSAYLDNMIRRDRSHVSVGIWGIFNEQAGPNRGMRSRKLADTTKVFDFAVSYLPKMRQLDRTRLILLSSGRWDARADIGSFSNPGSSEWNYGWGGECADAQCGPFQKGDPDLDPYISPMGDNHLYPTVPLQNRLRDFVRNIGRDTNPVFLSEYGVGTQLDLHDLSFDQLASSHKDHPSIPYYSVQLQRLEEWIDKYSLGHVYPTGRDFLMASIYAGAEQRRESIDPVRANPNLCGYSMTSFTISNEGVYYRDGSLIPGITDGLRDSFAPLKWSIFMDRTQLYENTPVEVEIILCNEDVLPAGNYTATLSIAGKTGVAFREICRFSYPEGKPLAAPVIRQQLPGLPAGQYTLSVWLDGHRQPTCDKKVFRVHSRPCPSSLSGKLYTVGEMENAEYFLCGCGMTKVPSADMADIVAVGKLSGSAEALAAQRNEIFDLARKGSRVIILDGPFWKSANTSQQAFMQSIDYAEGVGEDALSMFGNCIYVRNWLYHLDSYIAAPDIFEELADVGLLDMDLFRLVYPDHYLTDTVSPAKTFCASFGSGLFAKDNCIAGLAMGEFAFGKGRVTINTFKLLENIGNDPVADRLLYNLFR